MIVNVNDWIRQMEEKERQMKLNQKDVWGNSDVEGDKGMRVGLQRGICPIWKDKLGYKECTFVCEREDYDEVSYWIEHVYGGGSISNTKELEENKIAIRANYTCW